ncbi:hypothetical protein Glove_449g26 [Diversispora epigaea]|uniref:Uncharacterized protein n=1 Tax=Diversispora epigaea TaxID=1348612 RepID=A0A397GUT0_9GLOM|nr:hypothetical protein Glove_449g26 [Diversispora epigaea]
MYLDPLQKCIKCLLCVDILGTGTGSVKHNLQDTELMMSGPDQNHHCRYHLESFIYARVSSSRLEFVFKLNGTEAMVLSENNPIDEWELSQYSFIS